MMMIIIIIEKYIAIIGHIAVYICNSKRKNCNSFKDSMILL